MWKEYNHMWCTTQCEDGNHQMWEKITKCDKSIVKCYVGTAECDNLTIKCEKTNMRTTKC